MMDYESNSYQLAIVYAGIVLWFVFFAKSLCVVAKSITGMEYKEFSDIAQIANFRQEITRDAEEIKSYNYKYNQRIAFLNAEDEVEKNKDEQLEEIVAHNSKVNNIRRGGSRRAIGLILAGLPPLFMSGAIFIVYDLDTSSPRKNSLTQDTNLAKAVSQLNLHIENLKTTQRRTEWQQKTETKRAVLATQLPRLPHQKRSNCLRGQNHK